ncbi:SDR family oxidoreductase [Rhodovulum sulfidophilum]|uniref:SDR family oxidoreductase n=1 Tax=Rhodovulum sulfidophilum TaxID=35806 RepID=UPI000951F072|nr:SDR family NAD(P)-dependent oxidoreductase [Rhodovulum sulfidophilum]MBK5925691.1 short-chain dehydrogenase [Rhodovulum sulfidophilum]MBL3551516.1 SDR family NAD(P)-dependent oxidoreductase [Rhodovulum sulfidophilum]MBL3585634.1 SDR family NAD(P)-dependent oxidoreductase [Rhodovulum sulfidophilum]OLS42593.1 short-chain dehydrogenase [Rhodovulum sulfidophilum]
MTRTLFITGASSGIGAATARAAVARGWSVGLMARSADKLDALATELGAAALALPGDATDPAAQEEAVARTVEHFGALHAAFANAGRGLERPGTEAGDPEDWRGMVDLNVMGVLFTARAALPHLRRTKGHLVLTGSAAGRTHIKGSIYSATKWFVHGYGGNMSEEMREWGGRCTVISPGMVDTPFFDSPKPDKIRPEDVADAVLYALEQNPRAELREIHIMPTG